ncbi:MAG: GxxExxY protein [Bacteroidales bacterium]
MKTYTTKKQVTQLSYEITGLAIEVHRSLGPGLLESIYEKCLLHELIKHGYHVVSQLRVPINYKDIVLDADLKLDILVEDTIVVELKAIENILPVHEAQLMTYMKLLEKPQGLLINFFTDNISKSIRPIVNEYFRDLPDE